MVITVITIMDRVGNITKYYLNIREQGPLKRDSPIGSLGLNILLT